jgi:hypothetical protein
VRTTSIDSVVFIGTFKPNRDGFDGADILILNAISKYIGVRETKSVSLAALSTIMVDYCCHVFVPYF